MSDLKFSRDGRHMLARDFMGLKLWDVRAESAPVATFPIHEHLKPKVGATSAEIAVWQAFLAMSTPRPRWVQSLLESLSGHRP